MVPSDAFRWFCVAGYFPPKQAPPEVCAIPPRVTIAEMITKRLFEDVPAMSRGCLATGF
jgi:hypothetical protein